MKILFYDRIQDSDAPASLKSAALADKLSDSSFTITFDASESINCIGIGYTDATTVTVNGEDITFDENGLYLLDTPISGTTLTISHDGTYIGRLAAGQYVELGCSQSREPGISSTANPRRTLAGQIIPGAGGITFRTMQVDVKYKINSTALTQIKNGMNAELGKGFPIFVLFDKEYDSGNGRFPWERLYATIGDFNAMVFQSAVNRYIYSRKFQFEEAF